MEKHSLERVKNVFFLLTRECVFLQRPNFLILDEPSNDIDINTLAALESYLQEFKGVLLIVSHDRFFTDKVTDHLFVFEGNGLVKDYMGSLSEYADCLVEQEKNSPQYGDATSTTTQKQNDDDDGAAERRKQANERRRAANKAKKEMKKLEKSMEKLKASANELQQELDEASSTDGQGWTVLAELTDKLQNTNDQLEEQELEWLELAEQVELAQADGIL